MPMDSCKYCVDKTTTKGCVRFFCISKKLNTQFWKTPKQELCDNTGSARETWEKPERKQLTTPGLFCLPEGILLRWSSWESTCLALTGGEQVVAPSFQETTALLHKAPLFANVGKKGLFLEFSPRKKCQSRYGTTKKPLQELSPDLLLSHTAPIPQWAWQSTWQHTQQHAVHPWWQNQILQGSHSGEEKPRTSAVSSSLTVLLLTSAPFPPHFGSISNLKKHLLLASNWWKKMLSSGPDSCCVIQVLFFSFGQIGKFLCS